MAKKKVGAVRGYHHGELRQALLTAGHELVAERGIDGFTLREVARRAGVSHNAPYHHFADKSTLIRELAAQAMHGLRDAMAAGRDRATGTALDRLQGVGQAYVLFAVERPVDFRLICKPEQHGLAEGETCPVEAAAGEAFAVLMGVLEEAREQGELVDGDLGGLALTCWSTVHGLSVLYLDGLTGKVGGPDLHPETAAAIVTAFVRRGLAAVPPQPNVSA